MNKKILIHCNSLIERGGSIACFDYAYYLRQFFNIDPYVVYDLKNTNREDVVDRFQKEFFTYGYEHFDQVQSIIDQQKIDYFYALKYGIIDHIEVKNARNLIHSVFSRDPSQVHGDVYAFISEWQSIMCQRKLPFVPHMLNLPKHDKDLRNKLNIPQDSIVVGRSGGKETFNIHFVFEVIQQILDCRDDIYFLFINTPAFCNHNRCIFLDTIVDLDYKVQFINTCDAMLHARDYGETFGIGVLEFASNGKQIISYNNPELQNTHPLGGRAHFLYLGNNCHKYTNAQTLTEILLNLEKQNPFNTDYLNEIYSPKRVTNQFYQVFLQ